MKELHSEDPYPGPLQNDSIFPYTQKEHVKMKEK